MKEFNDGKTSSAVGKEWATSIRLPIIPDADEYTKNFTGSIYTVRMPPGSFGGEDGCLLAFTKENGDIIEAWMAKHCVASRGDMLVVRLEDQGCVRLGVRRGGH